MTNVDASITQDKQLLRQAMRRLRRGLTPAQQAQHGRGLRDRLSHLRQFQASRRIALYLDRDGEIGTRQLLELCWRNGKEVYLPVILRSGDMRFHCFRRGQQLRTGRYGIAEPAPSSPVAAVSELDLVLTPLVAFSSNGERLGMGGGYYDRAFASRRGSRPVLLGVAHDCQLVETLPTNSWDVRLHGIVTERRFLRAST